MNLPFSPVLTPATAVTGWRAVGWLLRLATAAALAIDAYVHADLFDHYAVNSSPGTLGQGDLFHIEAGAASLAALLVILSGRRLVWAFAALVAASALAAIIIYANRDIGSIGPIPDMYEPLWYPEKRLTAWAEAIATGLALLGYLLAPRLRQRRGPHQQHAERDHIDAPVTPRA
jgi:hypothetical protein